MTQKSFLRMVAVCSAIPFILSFFSGCIVGRTISSGYENFLTYFNTYYNAKRLFDDAEDQIRDAQLQARTKPGAAGQDLVPGSAKQELNQVLDKCSNILAYHSTSNLVDEAIVMSGKSFFYLQEYRKAERKFEELLTQYPKSSLVFEAQFWLAQTKDKLRNTDDAIQVAQTLLTAAQAEKKKEYATRAAHQLALLYIKKELIDEAEKYFEIALQSASDEESAQIALELGDLYFRQQNYSKALEAYQKVEAVASDDYFIYTSKIQSARVYRHLEQYTQSQDILNMLYRDFRYKDFRAPIRLELARTLRSEGRDTDAVAEYYGVDTAYAKSEYAFQAAIELGKIYEHDKSLRDYKSALKYYLEASTLPGDSTRFAMKKSSALKRYFASYQMFHKTDSLFVALSDTGTQFLSDSIKLLQQDSLSRVKNDTTIKKLQAEIERRHNLPTADSLQVMNSIAAYDLGDVFYDEMENPDSSIVWYSRALRYHYDSIRSPRILFILAELSRTKVGQKYSTTDEYYKKLETDFPESIYAREARRIIGKETISLTDTAAERYQAAERLLDRKEYIEAKSIYTSIVKDFPRSPLVPKSEFAVAWIWENGLVNNDSALVQYKSVAKKYPGTIYASQAMRRFVVEQDTVKKDTSALKTAPSNPIPRAMPNLKPDDNPALQDSLNIERPQAPNEGRRPRRPVRNDQ